MNLINIVIDNKKIKVPYGITVLEAARLSNFYIPTLCNHPNLPSKSLKKPSGFIFQGNTKIENAIVDKYIDSSCGLCLVEIENEDTLSRSCSTKIKKGMKIYTNNKKIKEKRKENLIPIISKHPHACLTCAQKEGCDKIQCSSNVPENERCCSNFASCEFKDVSTFIGIPNGIQPYLSDNLEVLKNQPLIIINHNLCIKCSRCIRICNDVRGVGALNYIWDKNGKLQIGMIKKSLIESGCKFCTACVEVCPTGALKDREDYTFVKKEKTILPCQYKCPAKIDIPEFIRNIAIENFHKAYKIIKESVPIPGILGRVCLHPCEQVCKRNNLNKPISICALKRFISDKNISYNKINSFKIFKKNKRIAIIGAGPTGLTASYYLNKMGYDIILYEKKSKPGGLLRYGIPEYRLPKYILDKEIDSILNLGIVFIPNKNLGTNLHLEKLRKEMDAVLLTTGSQKDKKLKIDGANSNEVIGAIDFLNNINNNKISIKDAIVIGGGNVAIDVAMTARRHGCNNISIVCLESEKDMPANNWEIKNAKNEGIDILFSLSPKKIIKKEGEANELELVKCICLFDKNGNFNPTYEESISRKIKYDMIIVAIGQESETSFLNSSKILIKNGLIDIDDKTLETSVKGIYAAGDAISMPGSVVEAVASGKKVASSIDINFGGSGFTRKIFQDNKTQNYYLGKNLDFGKLPREEPFELDHEIRSNTFNEIVKTLNKKQAIREAKRCLQCDLRLYIESNPLPPKKLLNLTIEDINSNIPIETEGVYKIFDKNFTIISIVGTKTLKCNLIKAFKNNQGVYFEFEKEMMYSKRENELLQQHMQKHGIMPEGEDNMDDLF